MAIFEMSVMCGESFVKIGLVVSEITRYKNIRCHINIYIEFFYQPL